jgi:membrane carboxypeptidase/penicillin-binding protein PbpC
MLISATIRQKLYLQEGPGAGGGMPRRTPPPLPACAAETRMEAPRIASPLRKVTYALCLCAPQDRIALDASVAADVQRVFWFDGSALIGVRSVVDGALPWRPTAAGVHLVRVIDDRGRSAERDVDVRFADRTHRSHAEREATDDG